MKEEKDYTDEEIEDLQSDNTQVLESLRDTGDLSYTRVLEQMTDSEETESVGKKKKNDDEEEVTSIGHEILLFIRDIAICVAVMFIAVTFLVRPIEVRGSSMYPTLHEHDRGVANIIGYTLGGIDRFDIAIIYLAEKNEYLVKRVVGLPGETIQYSGGVLYVNGEEVAEDFLDEEYAASYGDAFMSDVGPVTLGEDEYYCLGDNRPQSTDSRFYGPFTSEQIKARGAAVVLPLNHIGIYSW